MKSLFGLVFLCSTVCLNANISEKVRSRSVLSLMGENLENNKFDADTIKYCLLCAEKYLKEDKLGSALYAYVIAYTMIVPETGEDVTIRVLEGLSDTADKLIISSINTQVEKR